MNKIGILFLVVLVILLEWISTGIIALDLGESLECERKFYDYKVVQADSKGRECWDIVRAASCIGRCESMEIADWKFPYKKVYHPVCVHDQRNVSFVMLRNCHPEAGVKAKRYEFVEADTCKCHVCESADTICEAPYGGVRKSVKKSTENSTQIPLQLHNETRSGEE